MKESTPGPEPLPEQDEDYLEYRERIEALAEAVLALVAETPDITLAEIAERLARDRGERFAPSVLHRFFARRGITFKKNRARQRAGSA